jgi:hypothetical protein
LYTAGCNATSERKSVETGTACEYYSKLIPEEENRRIKIKAGQSPALPRLEQFGEIGTAFPRRRLLKRKEIQGKKIEYSLNSVKEKPVLADCNVFVC